MAAKSFRGGIHPLSRQHEGKMPTAGEPLRVFPPPKQVVLPLQMHLGKPCTPLVQKGDRVLLGQKIGEPDGLGAPIHASVSGIVTRIAPYQYPTGAIVDAIFIENDEQDETAPALPPYVGSVTPQQIRERVLDAGIVGMGGAAFPSHVKLTLREGVKVDTLIINGSECEPYLSCDHRLMLERDDALLEGLTLLADAVGAKRRVIGIEDNKPDAIKKLQGRGAEVISLPAKYPQGSEKMMIQVITGREVPFGKIPADVGVVVFNVSTAIATYEAVRLGKPLYERALTVGGPGIEHPANFVVRIGTPIKALVEACGIKGEPGKVMLGGPMMGITIYNLEDNPALKSTSGITVQRLEDAFIDDPGNCIRCGQCVRGCPIHIMPMFIAGHAKKRQWEKCEYYGARECIECGCCSYICPARLPLTPYCKLAKREIETLNRQKKERRTL